MTSLSISVFGTTDSNRNIYPIILASKLPVDHIVRNIWFPVIQSDSMVEKKARSVPTAGSSSIFSILEWVAASVNSAPRLVEMMGTALQKELIASGPLTNRKTQLLKRSIAAVLSSYESEMDVRYPKVTFPTGKYLYALIHGKPVALDNVTLGFIRTSTFTNSITKFQEVVGVPDIVPESALSLLANVELFDSCAGDHAVQIKKEIDQIWRELKNHVQSPASVKGAVLEDVFARVLRMRILSAHLKEKDKGTTSLLELLAIYFEAVMYICAGKPFNAATIVAAKGTKKGGAAVKKKRGFRVKQDGVNRSLAEWTANTFESFGRDPTNRRKSHLLNEILSRTIFVPDRLIVETVVSSRNRQSWKEDVKRIDQTLSVMKPWPSDDHCDLMLFKNRSSLVSRDEIVVVFEEKSKEEGSDNNEVWLGHFYQDKDGSRPPYEQCFKFCAATSTIVEEDLDGDGGFLRALKEGRFLYVYLTMHPGPNVYLTSEDLKGIAATNSSGLLVLNRDVTKNILGITFDVYALARSVV